jgi:RND family efflux transporter MFP subunit
VGLSRPPEVAVTEVRQAQPGEQRTELSAAGYVASQRRSVVAPQVAGRLVALEVNEGDAVEQGQVLARLDDRDARVALARARAELQAARQRLEAARASSINARRERRRAEQLAGQQVITRADLDRARTEARSARAAARAAAAQLAAARRAVEAAELQLAHTVVRAPFAGTVVSKLADEGAVLAPAALTQENVGGIVELVDLAALEVEAEVSEEQLSRVRPGQPALIFLDAFPEQVFTGAVRTVSPTIDRSKATAEVKVRFAQVPEGALPNMGARVALLSGPLPPEELAREAAALRVPYSSVVEREGQVVVWVVEDGRLRPEPVEVLERVGDEVVLEQGPAPGTQVVTAPDTRLRPGRRVRVQREAG